jgi:hypothetical protein
MDGVVEIQVVDPFGVPAAFGNVVVWGRTGTCNLVEEVIRPTAVGKNWLFLRYL